MRILSLLSLSLLPAALASSGDNHPLYTSCHAQCVDVCPAPSILSQLVAWDCAAQCGYECGHALTDASDAGTERYHQFHGKWAFHRWALMQEPASVIFSLGNFAVHYKGLQDVRRRVGPSNGLRKWLVFAAFVQMNTWIWSAVFHTRDLPWTERLDYFSATVTIGLSLHYAVMRVFQLQTARAASPLLHVWSAAVALVVVGHFSYVSSLPRFPYGYHVAFAAALGMLGNAVWVGWSVSFVARLSGWPAPYPGAGASSSNNNSPRTDWTPAVLVALTTAAMSLELLDFPPLARALDAHALWHLATIPLGLAWWDFMIRDVGVVERGEGGRPE